MSGDSSRFYNEGYANPKYELTLGDRQVFDYVLDPFLCYQNTLKFLFVVKTPDAADFLLTKMSNLSIQDFEIVNINQSTRGQADTARLGLVDQRKSDPVSIFNIDTIIKEYKPVDFSSPAYSEFSGVLEVFEDDGENWSYIKPDGIDVIEAREKEPISNLASNGMYYFRSVDLYLQSYNRYYERDARPAIEHYIAPIYNQLIMDGHRVTYTMVDKANHVFCGTPLEYENCKKAFNIDYN